MASLSTSAGTQFLAAHETERDQPAFCVPSQRFRRAADAARPKVLVEGVLRSEAVTRVGGVLEILFEHGIASGLVARDNAVVAAAG